MIIKHKMLVTLLVFKREINKKTYIADYTSKNNTILAYFREIGYDYSSQETLRHFYGNFNDVLRSANVL